MRELESSLQQFGEFLLRAQLVRETSAPHVVRWVRRFLTGPASPEPLADQTRRFCDELERSGRYQEWQVRQAEQAVRIYFVNFLRRTDWNRPPDTAAARQPGTIQPFATLDEARARLRTRHYAYRTECTYIGWIERFLRYAAEHQENDAPSIGPATVRNDLTHLATRQGVSASTQNKALCALLFLCRDVLGFEIDGFSATVRARQGTRLPVVLSMPEVAALLASLQGTNRLMATLIYGGGLRVFECCELRVKDIDFDQGLVFVRNGKGDKDQSTRTSIRR